MLRMADLRVVFTRKNGSSSASLLLTVLNSRHPFLQHLRNKKYSGKIVAWPVDPKGAG
jgi:hypothetical protein